MNELYGLHGKKIWSSRRPLIASKFNKMNKGLEHLYNIYYFTVTFSTERDCLSSDYSCLKNNLTDVLVCPLSFQSFSTMEK